LLKSVPSNSPRTDTPHASMLVEAFPHIVFGNEAMSVVGRAAASIPYSISISPEVVEEDHVTEGSSPPISAKSPFCTLIES